MAISSRSHQVLINGQQGLIASSSERLRPGIFLFPSQTPLPTEKRQSVIWSAQETLGRNSELAKARKKGSCGMRLEGWNA